MASTTQEISVYIDWQFDIEAPDNKELFLEAVKEYQHEVSSELPWPMKIYQKTIRTSLEKKLGVNQLTVVYEYSVEQASGDWLDHKAQITIANRHGVTYGDILFALHHETDGKLRNQDIMAIEGFEVTQSGENGSHPSYFVFFGS